MISTENEYEPLSISFYERSAVEVAPDLLDCLLIRQFGERMLIGRISETEAYVQDDPASHSFNGKTKRNAVMFGVAGRAYIYFTYGMHYCFNVSTGNKGAGEAVLIRSLEAIQGLEQMGANRRLEEGNYSRSTSFQGFHERISLSHALCGGPAKICQAFAIDLSCNGDDLTIPGKIWISRPCQGISNLEPPTKIVGTPRIGIRKATDRLLRFTRQNELFASRKQPLP